MDIIYKGVWFLAQSNQSNDGGVAVDNNDKLDGTLTISQNNDFTLETIGEFNNLLKEQRFIIYGNTTDGKAITLFGCFDMGGQFNSGALKKLRKYRASSVAVTRSSYENPYLDSLEDLTISELKFKSFNLSSWLFNNNYIIDDYDNEYIPGKVIQVKYKLPHIDEGVKLNSNLLIKIHTYPIISSLEIGGTERSITEKNYISINGENLNLNNAINSMNKVLHFLTIAIGQLQSAEEISFISNKTRFDYYFRAIKPQSNKKIYPQYMFFSYREIKAKWGELIKRWFNIYDEIGDTISLYFSLFYNQTMYFNQKFLLLVQFLESFHRKINPITKDKINKWKEKLDLVFKDTIGSKDKKDLKGKLKYGYEPSLEARLNDLFKTSKITSELFVDRKYAAFTKRVALTRNYLSHYGNKPSNVIEDAEELNQATIKLDKLARYKILKLLGFNESEMKEITKKFYWFDSYVIK